MQRKDKMGMSRLPGANWIPYVVGMTVLAGTASTQGGEHHYVLRDGRKIPMVQSRTEMAVVFHRGAGVKAARKRIEATEHGIIRDIKDAPHASVKILEVGSTKKVQRSKIRMDESVEDIRPVFRYVGVDSPLVPTGQIVLKLRPGMSEDEIEALWTEFGIVSVDAFEGLAHVYIVKPNDGVDDVILAEKMADDGRTLWANPNFRRTMKRQQVGGSDPFFDLQWHLDNTGIAGGIPDADIDAPEAWLRSTGTGIIFGMLDDACDVDHPDLVGRYIGTGQDVAAPFFDEVESKNPRPKDPVDNHGTAVMGLAVASANSIGVRGVAFNAQFTATRGLLEFIPDTFIAEAFTFAIEQNVDVHINSWGFIAQFPVPPVYETAIETAFQEGRDLDGPGGDDPLGMVIVFAAGNNNEENLDGFSLAALPQVISVGASTREDIRAGFSSFGGSTNFLAPGGADIRFGVVTTDVEDAAEGEVKVTEGFNIGGNILGDPDFPDIDPEGSWTGFFGGTSASCPIAAGVAGLILSANPNLTATDVRIIMEHSSDPISPNDAQYDPITQRSFKYGYGRINADRAVTAAIDAKNNGGFTWPESPRNLRVQNSNLKWESGSGANEFLVIESTTTLEFIPEEGGCYSSQQSSCAAGSLLVLPNSATVVTVVSCGGECAVGDSHSVPIMNTGSGVKQFVVWARSEIGRYSFGSVTGAIQPPSVTITAAPLNGSTPLTVFFNGNALSTLPITSVVWDFDVADPESVNKFTLSTDHTYVLDNELERSFIARLTVTDELGNVGDASVHILVTGGTTTTAGLVADTNDFRILIGTPGSTDLSDSVGDSPLSVELSVVSNTLANPELDSAQWDLGDGSPLAQGLTVLHEYINTTTSDMVLPITATLEMRSADQRIRKQKTTRLVTIRPVSSSGNIVNCPLSECPLPGTTPIEGGGLASPCGTLGLIPMFFGFTGLLMLRRRRS
jgi:subtilisin family serine protease